MMPRVSVVIPTCNRPDMIGGAIESVLAQTYSDFEVLVIDDGDNVRADRIVAAYSDPRIRYFKNDPPKRGGGASRNIGVANATGEYIAFLDDDDMWLPDKLRVQVEALDAAPKAGFCVVGARTESEKGIGYNIPPLEGVADFSQLALRRFAGFLTTALTVKRDVLVSVGGFDARFPSHQEAELMIRVTRAWRGIGIKEPLVVMNMFEHEHINKDRSRQIRGREMLIEKHAELFAAHPRELALHYFQLGIWCRDSSDLVRARRYFIAAFLLSRNLRHLAHAVVVSGRLALRIF